MSQTPSPTPTPPPVAAVSDSNAETDAVALRFSCLACRSRKMKCDKARPVCSRCVKGGEKCVYPATRKRHEIVATRPKVKDLEARLVDLEIRLRAEKEQNAQAQEAAATANAAVMNSFDQLSPLSYSTDLIDTGRTEQLPPQPIVEELLSNYFTRIHSEGPMLHQSRYIASIYMPPHMQPPMCLQYAVLALAASISPGHRYLAEPFYRRSRQYMELDEMKGDGIEFLTVAHVQAWILLARFEAQTMWFSRATMSGARAVRLCQMLGLDKLDDPGTQGQNLPPAADWCELEERRRTFWTTFSMDRSGSSTTGWPALIDHRRVRTALPASDEAFDVGIEEPTITLQQSLRKESVQQSTYACRVLASHLFHQCVDISASSSFDNDDPVAQNVAFWGQFQELDTGLTAAQQSLPSNLRFPQSIRNVHSSLVGLRLHTARICLHRAGLARIKAGSSGVNLFEMLQHSQSRLVPAADEIYKTVSAITDADARFREPFVAFAAFMAGLVFLDDFAATQAGHSDEKLGILQSMLILTGNSNPMTSSLAVQLAHQTLQAGVDPDAVNKVQHLMVAMKPDAPLLGKQDQETGSVTFCPFQAPAEPSKVFVNIHTDAQKSFSKMF